MKYWMTSFDGPWSHLIKTWTYPARPERLLKNLVSRAIAPISLEASLSHALVLDEDIILDMKPFLVRIPLLFSAIFVLRRRVSHTTFFLIRIFMLEPMIRFLSPVQYRSSRVRGWLQSSFYSDSFFGKSVHRKKNRHRKVRCSCRDWNAVST